MGGHERVGQAGQLVDVGSQLTRAEGAVQPHDERPRVADRVPECLDGVAREGPAAGVGDRAGNPERDLQPEFFEYALDRKDRGLRVEDVEDRLDHEQIGATENQPAGRLRVCLGQLFEGDGTGGRVGHVRGDGGGLVRRAERAGDEPRPVGLARLGGIGGGASDPGRLEVDLVRHVLQPVVGLGDARRGERVGRDYVRAGRQIGVVDGANYVGTSQAQEVVVAADVARMVAETFPPEIGL